MDAEQETSLILDARPEIWKVYCWGWSQYILYLFLGAISWTCIGTGLNLLWSLPLGFSVYNIWMLGHDAAHQAVFPARYHKSNSFIAFLALDCFIMTRKSWHQVHHKEHHAFPNSSIDGQRLMGNGFFAEVWNVFLLVIDYLRMDLRDCFQQPTLFKITTLVIRYTFLVSIGWGLPLTIFWLVVFGAYFGLLSHSAAPISGAKGFRQKQLSNTVDFMPGNWLAEFCAGGLNSHAVHHVWPQLPRGLHGWASAKLKQLEPQFYRSYDFKGTVLFLLHHKNPPEPTALPSPSAYYQE
jgi:fatty acid desaturase